MDDFINKKIQISYREVPYIYVKMSTINNSYRLSANYKYLNEQYNLKINFLRNLDTLFNNEIFIIKDQGIHLNKKFMDMSQSWRIQDNELNNLNVTRLILNDKYENSIIILKRDYFGDINYSLFFCSTFYHSLAEFLKDTGYDS